MISDINDARNFYYLSRLLLELTFSFIPKREHKIFPEYICIAS